MYYFLSSPYIDQLYTKASPYLENATLLAKIGDEFFSSDDQIIYDQLTEKQLPEWIKSNQKFRLTDNATELNDIYKYQSYLDILRQLKGKPYQIIGVVSDEPCGDYAKCLAKQLSLTENTILIDFNLNVDSDILFDLHGTSELPCERLEQYLVHEEQSGLKKLTLFRSLRDMMAPPQQTILNIIKSLNEKYHIILNLIPLRTEFDLDMLKASNQVIYISQNQAKLSVMVIEQLKHLLPEYPIYEIYAPNGHSSMDDQLKLTLKKIL